MYGVCCIGPVLENQRAVYLKTVGTGGLESYVAGESRNKVASFGEE